MASIIKVIAASEDDKHDLVLNEQKQLLVLTGIDAYSQIVNCKMRTVLGEMQLNNRKGLPYLQTVFSDASAIPMWVAEVRSMLESIPFVIKVENISIELENGILSYRSIISTDLGNIPLQGKVDNNALRIRRRQASTADDVSHIIYFVSGMTGVNIDIEPIVGKTGAIISLPIPDVEGYRFIAWYSDESLSTIFNSRAMPNTNITLYAKFVSKE